MLLLFAARLKPQLFDFKKFNEQNPACQSVLALLGLHGGRGTTLVSIHKRHLLSQYGVLRGFAPAACKEPILNVAMLRLR